MSLSLLRPYQLLQESFTPLADLLINPLKAPGVPGILHFSGAVGVGEQQGTLALRVAAENHAQAGKIAHVHAEEEVEAVVVSALELPGTVISGVQAMLAQGVPGFGIDGVAQLLGADGGGIHLELLRQAALLQHVAEDDFGHGATADVAVADEEDVGHGFIAP